MNHALTFPRAAGRQARPWDRELATFLLELAALDYQLIHVPPSLVAAAAFAAALRILGSGDWVRRLSAFIRLVCELSKCSPA